MSTLAVLLTGLGDAEGDLPTSDQHPKGLPGSEL